MAPFKKKSDLRFAFLPDLHYKFIDEMQVSVSNIVHTINELNKNAKIDFLCLGGDNVGNYPPSPEAHVEMMAELASLLSHSDVPVFCVQGNHDDNSIHGRLSPESNVCRIGMSVSDDVPKFLTYSSKSGVAIKALRFLRYNHRCFEF